MLQMSYLSDKIGPGLSLSLQLPEALREKNDSMWVGYDSLNRTWEVVVKYHGSLHRIAAELNVDIEILSERYAIITLPTEKIAPLSSFNEIEYMEKPKLVSPMIESSISGHHTTQTWAVNSTDTSGHAGIMLQP